MNFITRSTLLIAAITTLSGCGQLLGGGNYSCDLRPKDAQCTDWRNLIGPATTQEALCKTLGTASGSGTWAANAKCPAANSVGGCQTDTHAGLQTNWFYAPKTVDEVKAECQSDGTTYVATP